PSLLSPPHLQSNFPYKYWTLKICAFSSSLTASYVISVRRASALPAASFRFLLAMDTLAVRLTIPLVGFVGDFHSLVRAPCRAHTKIARQRTAGPLVSGESYTQNRERQGRFRRLLEYQRNLAGSLYIHQRVKPPVYLKEKRRLFSRDDLFKKRNVFLPRLCHFDLNVAPTLDHANCLSIGQRFLVRCIFFDDAVKLVVMFSHLFGILVIHRPKFGCLRFG